MSLPRTAKVIEHCQISPPPNSVPTTSFPLTFFDIPYLLCRPMQRIFFYEFPYPTLHFIDVILPALKHSLALALQHFFPLAGTLVCPPQPTKPHIIYTNGDSVPFTIAESSGNFAYLLGNYERDVREFHPLVPQLPAGHVSADPTVQALSLLALQLTIFPNSGISIASTFHHIVADGRTFNHFMKSWASIFRSKGDSSCIEKSLPFYDRAVINDSEGLETIFLNQWWTWRSSWKEDTDNTISAFKDKVRATFVMGGYDIERLKQWILTQCKKYNYSQPLHISTFVVTCAFIWASLVKSYDSQTNNNSLDDDECQHFCFVADCRNRDDFHIPATYFGNCLALCFVSVKKEELMGENGVVVAAKATGSRVGELKSGVLRGAEKWMSNWKDFSEYGHILTVAGSPKLDVYKTDFGWGRPSKSEVVQIDASGAFSLAECRDQEGGIEVGLALNRVEMKNFISIFEEGLKVLG